MFRRLWHRLALILLLALAPTVAADDWPMLGRDRSRNAVSSEKNPPQWWVIPDPGVKGSGKNVKWQAELGHRAKGDPVVANGLVWVGTDNGQPRDPKIKDQLPALMCFREKDGAFLYQYVTAIPPEVNRFNELRFAGHSSAPLVEKGRMWFTTVVGEVVCLDVSPLERGQGQPREIWKLDMAKTLGVFPSPMPMGYGRTCSVAGFRDYIYVLTGNGAEDDGQSTVPAPNAPSLVCLHKDTGKVIWSDASPGKNIIDGQYASPLVAEINGQAQLIAPMGDGWIRAFDAVSGAPLWRFDGSSKELGKAQERSNWYGTPVLFKGRVYIGTGESPVSPRGVPPGWLYCLDPSKKGDISSDVEVAPGKLKANPNTGMIWRFGGLGENKRRQFSGTLASVCVQAGLVIANDSYGYVICLDAEIGKLYWKHDIRSTITGAPLIAGDKVFIGSEDGEVFVLALQKEKRVLDCIDIGDGISTGPVFANGVCFVASSGTLYAIAGKGRKPAGRQGHDWPQFGRDQTRNAVSPEKKPPVWWEVDEPPWKNILWSTALGSMTYGDPVVVDGMIWVGTNNHDSKKKTPDASVLTCLDRQTGNVLYRYVSPRLKGLVHDWPYSSMGCSPLIEGKRMWFINNRCEVVCLDIEPLRQGTGVPRQVWMVDLPKQLQVFPHGTPMAMARRCSVAAHGDRIFVATGNGTGEDYRTVPAPDAPSLVCFDKNSGKVVWTDHSPGKNIIEGQWASPLVIEVGGQAQVVVPQGDGWVRAFKAETGALIWKFDTNPRDAEGQGPIVRTTRNNILATPVFYDQHVFIGNGMHPEHRHGPAWTYCIDPSKTGDISPEVEDGPGKGKANPNSGMVWRFGGLDGKTRKYRFSRTVSNVAVDRGLVIAPDIFGMVHCLDARTGQEYWTHDTREEILSSPLIVDGKVYVGTNGRVCILALQKTKQVLDEIEMPDRIWCSPVFAHGVLYLATANRLFAIAGNAVKPDPEKGEASPQQREPDRTNVEKKERPRAPDAIFVPTPQDVVDKMLEIAGVQTTDRVADLGCGDGRIVVTAAKKYGCRAVGYDLDPRCIQLARDKVRSEKVEDLVTIEQKDVFALDLSQVDVVALYLLPRLNVKLLPQLKKLRPGARIVSHQFPMAGIRPDRVVRYLSREDGIEHTLYLWTVPLKTDTPP